MKEWGWPFVIGLAVGAILVIAVWRLGPATVKRSSLKVTGPDGKGAIEFSVEGEAVDYSQVLDKMFKDDFLRAAAIGWLEEQKKLYPIRDERLVTAIARDLCDPIPDTPLEDRLTKGKACASLPVVSGLRALAAEHKPPFHYVGVLVTVGIPEEPKDRPPTGRANVCREGGFLGKRLQVINPRTQATIEVEASNYYPCTGFVTYPGIQLGPQDAKRLFGNQPLASREDVIIVPLE